jgi:hypothetical protein
VFYRYSVTEIGGTVICKEFEHAFSMLKEGKCSFRQVIESEDTVERPLDPDSLDYKYGTKGFRHLGEKIVRKEEIHC